MSSGEIVPEVMTTLLNFSKTGAIAREGSKHLQNLKRNIVTVECGHIRESENGIWHSCIVRLERFQDKQKS